MKFSPIIRTVPHHSIKVWGGANLLNKLGKRLPATQRDAISAHDPVGECWEVADLSQGQSFVLDSDGQEHTLKQAIATLGSGLTGSCGKAPYPLLIKTLDAAKDLSIQVHPGSSHLHLFDEPHVAQKDECWVILDAEPQGSILHGFKPGVTRAAFTRAVEAREDLSGLMRRHVVSRGEVVHVPPGTVHAICAGVTLLEVQQPSDTTFRVWDYERPGLDGLPRPLHLEQALKVLNFGEQPDVLVTPKPASDHAQVLIETAHYRLTKITPSHLNINLSEHLNTLTHATSLHILSGDCMLHAGDVQVRARQGDFLLLNTAELAVQGDCELILIEAL